MLLRSFAAASSLLIACFSAASADSWERVGPLAGNVYYAAIHPTNPQIVYFAADDGQHLVLNRTLDGGATFSAVPILAWEILFDPVNPDIAYAYGGPAGIYKSVNAGATWSELSLRARSLTIDPNNPDRLFAGGQVPASLYGSTDGGATWSQLPSVGTWSEVTALEVDPDDSNIVYVGTSGDFDIPGEGLFKSTNGGTTWTNISGTYVHGNVASIAVDPTNTNIIYAAVPGGGNYEGDGLIKSTDGGATWTQSGFPLLAVSEVLVDPTHSGRVYALVQFAPYVSNDGGDTWTLLSTPAGVNDLDLFRSDTDVLCFGGHIGVYMSSDMGGHFTQWGTTPAEMTAVLVDRTNSNIVYATGRGRYKSTDGCAHWQPMGVTAFGTAIVQDPVDANVLYNGAYTSGGVEKSLNSGDHWTVSLSGKSINDVAVATSNSSVLYAGGLDRPFVGGIFKSVNSGGSWTRMSTAYGQTLGIAVDPTDENIVYVGGSTGLIKSIDGGATWSPIHNGLDQPASGWVFDVVIDPVSTGTVYCATQAEGVFKSIDGGATWTRLTNLLTEVRSLALDSEDRQVVYAGWYAHGVQVSVDGGLSWQQLGGAAVGTQDITVDFGNRDVLYAGGSGVYRYERTTQSPVPTIISHQPTFIDLSQCDSGCQLVFDVETPGDYSQIASVGLEREVGDAWVQEAQLWGPPESRTWQLQRTFHADDAPGAYVFRVVTRLADGARAVSAEVTVSVENGPTATVFSRVESTYRDGTALIRWDVASTASVRGFNVYRRREGERHFSTVNEQLIPPGERVFTDAGVTPGSRYVYQVGAVADDGEWLSEAARLSIPEVTLTLEQNHPNPFNPATAIAFSMPAAGSARLSIFNVNGELVTVLLDGPAPVGRNEITWDGRDSAGASVGSGVYFYRLDALKHSLTRRMVLLK